MPRRKIETVRREGQEATVYRDREWDEYVVKLKGRPSADYFTGDREDAIATARKMVGFSGLKRRRFGWSAEAHTDAAQSGVREVRRLTDRLKRELRNPPDCVSAARIALALAQEQGHLFINRAGSNYRSPRSWGAGSNAVLRRFKDLCIVRPRSAAAARKMRAVWR